MPQYKCDKCGTQLESPDSAIGRQESCYNCGNLNIVPEPVQGQVDPQQMPPIAHQPRPQYMQTNPTGKATASLVLGIIGLIAWIIPLFGLPVTITGLVLGVKGRKSVSATTATVGVVLSIIGLTLSVINAAWGAYLGATGQHPLIK